jgi:hypothetical protein
MVARKVIAGGMLVALILAGTVALTGLPAQAQTWHRVFIYYGYGPAPQYYQSEGNCHTVVYPDGATYSTCSAPNYTYYYGPRYQMYYMGPGYYEYGR